MSSRRLKRCELCDLHGVLGVNMVQVITPTRIIKKKRYNTVNYVKRVISYRHVPDCLAVAI